MALIHFESDQDPWLWEFDACERLQRDITEQLHLRDRDRRTTDEYAHISAGIRLRMKQFNNEVGQLKIKNDQSLQKRHITAEEHERRTRLIEILQSKELQMQSLFQKHLKPDDRNRLLKPTAVQDMGTVDWGTEDDDPPLDYGTSTSYTTEDIRKDHQRILEDQEKGLDQLSKIISRQKNIATTICTEVELQNDIIDDLADNMERTGDRVRNETQQIGFVSRRDSTWGYWLIIILLCVTIIVVGTI